MWLASSCSRKVSPRVSSALDFFAKESFSLTVHPFFCVFESEAPHASPFLASSSLNFLFEARVVRPSPVYTREKMRACVHTLGAVFISLECAICSFARKRLRCLIWTRAFRPTPSKSPSVFFSHRMRFYLIGLAPHPPPPLLLVLPLFHQTFSVRVGFTCGIRVALLHFLSSFSPSFIYDIHFPFCFNISYLSSSSLRLFF